MEKSPHQQFQDNIDARVSRYRESPALQEATSGFFNQIGIGKADYVYNFHWLGIPIIQIPQDIQAMQEIIWQTKPDLIIETGVAWGGSLVFSASMLALLESFGQIDNAEVVGIDIEIRPHNRKALREHPLAKKITLIEGSSIEAGIVETVRSIAARHQRVMLCLDSNHTHDHVLAELEAYAPLVSPGCYCMVGDTIIEDAPESMTSHRPWGKGNSPKTAVFEYLRRQETHPRTGEDGQALKFRVDQMAEDRILLTGSPSGYLKRI